MPSLSTYQKMNGAHTNGEQRKLQSDAIMDATWDEDIATRDAYFYDWYHDDNKTQLRNMNPINDKNKVLMRVKFVTHTSQTMDKDPITYHLQLRPSQECTVDYYEELFANRYNAIFPCGMYVDLPDSKGKFQRWLVVAEADINDAQFPTFEVLKCNKVIQYVLRNEENNNNLVKYNVPGVLRSQNSYNSGIWADHTTTITQDQQKFIVPMNRETEKIYYNQRLILDNNVLTEPRTWQISKVNRIQSNGLALFTCAQTFFDGSHDYIEHDEDGNVVGMWADYFVTDKNGCGDCISDSSVEEYDEYPATTNIYSKITCSGSKPEMKIGGSYKTFNVTFYNDTEEIDTQPGIWEFYVGDTDVKDKLTFAEEYSDTTLPTRFKIDKTHRDDFACTTLTIKYISNDGVVSSTDINLLGL